jgi:hypothetical protein
MSQQEPDGRGDFDFFMGSWNVRSRRLREWLQGSHEWEAFTCTAVARKLLGEVGLIGHIEEFTMDRATGVRDGVALRFFEPRSQQWSIYSATGVNGLDPHPMVGEFKDGRGEFYSHELYKDRMLLCRVIWSEITATSLHWEQAFSTDGGRTWETNFISDFERRA